MKSPVQEKAKPVRNQWVLQNDVGSHDRSEEDFGESKSEMYD